MQISFTMLMTTYHKKKTWSWRRIVSFNTPRGDTSPRDMAEGMPFGLATTVCDTGMGLETLKGLDRDPWPRRSEPARQYNSTVTPHRGAQRGGGCLEIDRKQFDEYSGHRILSSPQVAQGKTKKHPLKTRQGSQVMERSEPPSDEVEGIFPDHVTHTLSAGYSETRP